MGTRRATVLAVAVAAALLGGCADSPSPSPTPGGSVSPSISSSGGLSPSPGEMTLTGQIVEGVEAGCRLLDDYLLLPGPGISRDDIRAGLTVTVRGRVERGMMTTCQQGTPFIVTEVL
jgi:hypothetical protein